MCREHAGSKKGRCVKVANPENIDEDRSFSLQNG